MFMLVEPETQTEVTSFRPGKDEMNFAEFPIALLTDRVPKGQKSIKFEDEFYDERRKKLISRKRVIEGSEEYGLPTATDDTVILALIQLTKQDDKTRIAHRTTRADDKTRGRPRGRQDAPRARTTRRGRQDTHRAQDDKTRIA
jgi:hypothetical protein